MTTNIEVPATHADLLDAPNTAVLTTVGAGGQPQSTAVWYLVDDDGALKTSLTTDRQKYRNLTRNPKATLFILDPANPYRTLEIRANRRADARPRQDAPPQVRGSLQDARRGARRPRRTRRRHLDPRPRRRHWVTRRRRTPSSSAGAATRSGPSSGQAATSSRSRRSSTRSRSTSPPRRSIGSGPIRPWSTADWSSSQRDLRNQHDLTD